MFGFITAYSNQIKEICEKYKNVLENDGEVKDLLGYATMWAGISHPDWVKGLSDLLAIVAYAYLLGRERGRKESAMLAMLSGESEKKNG